MAFQLFPSFSFDESDVGLRPVRTATLDRIGFVGVFSRGPVAPQIVDANLAETLYGFDSTIGSAHLQAVIDQGANDFIVSRVLALGAPQTGIANLAGTATADGSFTVTLTEGTTSITTAAIAVVTGETAAQVRDKAVAAVSLAASGITAENSGVDDINFKTRFNNDSPVCKVRFSTMPLGLTVTDTVGTADDLTATDLVLAGGIDDPFAAQAILKDGANVDTVALEVIWPGASGNDVTAAVVAGFEPNTFDLTLTLPNPLGGDPLLREVYKAIDLTDLYDTDKLSALRASNIVRARKITAGGVPATAALVAFSTGSDGDSAGAQFDDYVRAAAKLEEQQCTILVMPGDKGFTLGEQQALNEILLTMAEKSDDEMGELYGLRVAVLSAPRGTQISELPALRASGYIPNSKRAVMVAGWGTSSKLRRFKRFGIDPAAVYAGHLFVTPTQVSPAARTSSPFIRGITEVDTPTGTPAANELTKYRLEALILDPVSGGIHCLNGRSTSNDPAWYWICIRRVYDKIRMDIFFNFQFMKSEPSSKAMDEVVENSITAFLDNAMRSRLIAGYNPAVSNDSNNKPETRAAGIRFVNFAIEPYFPNDFTQFNISRVLNASVRLS